MRKGFVWIVCVLCLVLLGCNGDRGKDETQGYVDVQVDYSQRILFILSELSYSNGYENKGYFVMGDGKRYFFDLSKEDEKYAETDILYEYLVSHVSEFSSEELLAPEEVKKCIDHLYRVNEDAEITEEFRYAGGGQSDLYGVRYDTESLELVWLGTKGAVDKELLDENAESIKAILGED